MTHLLAYKTRDFLEITIILFKGILRDPRVSAIMATIMLLAFFPYSVAFFSPPVHDFLCHEDHF
jgi:hypothetical protein